MSSPLGRPTQAEDSSRTSSPSRDRISTKTLDDDTLVMTTASLSNTGEKGQIVFHSSREKVEMQTIEDVGDMSEKDSSSKRKGDSEATTLSAKQESDDIGELGGSAPMDDYPDGGFRAWLIVFGAMCNTFATFGYVNSWGIFQAYYQTGLLKDSDASNIAWIGSLQYALVFVPSLVVGRLFDIGYFRAIFLSSSALLITCTFLIPQCTEYWHFLLCQGLAVGLACGGLFGPTTAVIAHWFKKRRGMAMGFVAIGSSIGGTVIPIAARNLIPMVGFGWTMRIIGFILMVALGIANLILRRRLPPSNRPGGLLNLRAFRSAAYSVYCVSALITFLGIYTMLTYIGVTAERIGIEPGFSFYLISIANASSLFGRYTAGYVCDKIGPMNVMIPFTACAGIITYAWPFARTEASLIAVVILYGFCSGSYVSLVSNPLMDMGNIEDVGRRIGMYMTFLAMGAVAGPPISGAIATATGGYHAVGFYAGSAVLAGVLLMSVARYIMLGYKIRGRI